MEIHDQHLHSKHSFDCQTDPRANVVRAIDRGLTGLIFTEHFDTHPEEWDQCRYDDEAYSRTIDRLRDEFGERIFIGKGIEVCYQPDRMDFILDFLAYRQFDMIMLSVHWCGNRRIFRREDWGDLDAGAGTRVYLETVLAAARDCVALRKQHGRPCFDVLGHMDFVKRYSQRFFGRSAVDEHADVIDDILRTCLAAELVPEVNTSTLRHDQPEPMPGPNTMRRFAALGGSAMSIGSDAHREDSIGARFDDALNMLRDAGIARLTLFEDRRRRHVPLPKKVSG